MDVDQLRAAVEGALPTYLNAFGLPHWKVTLRFDLGTDDDGDPNFMAYARVNVLIDYDTALIRMDPSAFASAEEALESLRHELYHVVLSPYDLVRQVTAALAPDEGARLALDRLWRHASEKAVINLGRMFVGLAEARLRPADHRCKARLKAVAPTRRTVRAARATK